MSAQALSIGVGGQADMSADGAFPCLPDRPLRYGWYEGLASLRTRSYPGLSFDRVELALYIAEEFTERFATQAEAFGCQPVHIMKPPEADGIGGGLAWRWSEWTKPIGFAPRVIVARLGVVPPWSWALGRDGSAVMQEPEAHAAALAAIGLS